ncbi:hypothetical protein VEE72_13730 [Escherichia coli]|jgi:hypothetical protein|nr:hypothetical protein AB09_2435 [Escherichia coli 8-415-05_S1_C1]BBP25242.1 hypothetical protein VEGS07_13800 [Escherichia coli]BBP29712.1 hypothetical protein VEGS09_14130 [Escherichia coli]BDD23727.1 hypothetical protein VEGS18_A13820 [Escherichia coli]BDY88509.1 hypothetical protein MUTS14_17980 [Escherichia coli]
MSVCFITLGRDIQKVSFTVGSLFLKRNFYEETYNYVIYWQIELTSGAEI